MDFRGRNSQNTPVTESQPVNRAANTPANNNNNNNHFGAFAHPQPRKLFKYGVVALLFSLTALVIALTFLLGVGANDQNRAVQKDKYQAVFLNNGQVYFGNIASISKKTVDLRAIYYLQTNGTDTTAQTTSTSANVSLVKLGCELHAPYDQMLINADQVLFWENLQDSGKVVKAISDYKKQNTTQTCSTSSQTSTQQAPTTTAPATTTPTTTKKP